MREKNILDGRNLWDPERLSELGFTYVGVGLGKYI
jgi:UDPglucose 6-dehydrogenase